jgi:Flp pilus assembly protein CpaB
MQNKNILVLLVAVGVGLVVSILVNRRVIAPFNAVERSLESGEVELTVAAWQGDLVVGVLQPGQEVDVLVTETRGKDVHEVKLLAEKVQIAAIETDKATGSAPDGAQAPRIKLHMSKAQAEAIRPYQDSGNLRFIVRRPGN